WAFHGFAVVAVVPAVFLARLFLIEAGQLQARTKAVLAPAVLGVVGEHAWVRLGEAGAAAGAGPFDGEMLLAGIGQRLTLSALLQRHGTRWRQGSQHTEGAVTQFQRFAYGLAQLQFVAWINNQVGHWQF